MGNSTSIKEWVQRQKGLFTSIAHLLYALCTLVVPFLVPKCTAPQKQEVETLTEKHLKVTEVGYTNPLHDLKAWQGGGEVKLTIGGIGFSNISTYTAILQNSGSAAILPSDVHEPVTLNAVPPWEIVAVESPSSSSRYVELTWRKVTPTKFSAVPSLLNATDSCLITAYLTNPSKGFDAEPSKVTPPILKWNTRIAGLKEIDFQNKDLASAQRIETVVSRLVNSFEGYYVILFSKRLYATWIVGLLNLTILAHLLVIKGYTNLKSSVATACFVIAAAVSAGSAECITTYLYDDPVRDLISYFTNILGQKTDLSTYRLANMVPIILYALILVCLLFCRSVTNRKKRGSAS